MRYLRYVLVALVVGAWAAGPLPGAAAARVLAPTYQSSEPSKGATMHEPPSEVTVTFSEPLDSSSWMNVYDECGNEIDGGPATVQLTEMTVSIGKTPSGTYEVVYKAVGLAGGATGTSNSTFHFDVHGGKPCGEKKHHHPPPGKGKGKGKGHGDHDPKEGDDDHDDHDGGGDGGSGHSSGHSGMTGSSGSMSHSGHGTSGTMAGGGTHTNHRDPHHPGGTKPHPPIGDDRQTLAGGTGGVPVGADAEAVLMGLGLALAIGVLGGWLLRMSGNLTGTA